MNEAQKATDHNGEVVTVFFERRIGYINIRYIRDATGKDVFGRYTSAQIQGLRKQIQ